MKLVVPTKSATNWLRRPLVDLARRADLHDAALVHHRDLVRQRQRLALVVGDVDRREAELALQALELEAHAVAQLGVEIGQRLVEQQQLRLHHQRARQREPLLLAAGKLGRLAIGELIELHRGEHAHHLLADLASSSCCLRTSSGNATFWNTFMCGQMA